MSLIVGTWTLAFAEKGNTVNQEMLLLDEYFIACGGENSTVRATFTEGITGSRELSTLKNKKVLLLAQIQALFATCEFLLPHVTLFLELKSFAFILVSTAPFFINSADIEEVWKILSSQLAGNQVKN